MWAYTHITVIITITCCAQIVGRNTALMSGRHVDCLSVKE